MNYYLHIFLKGYLYPRVHDIESILKDLNLAVDFDKVYVRKERTLCDVNEFVYVTDTDCQDKVMNLELDILSREDVSDDSKMDVMLKPGEYFVASCEKYWPYLDFEKSFIKVTDDNCYCYENRGCLYDFAKSKMYLKNEEVVKKVKKLWIDAFASIGRDIDEDSPEWPLIFETIKLWIPKR